MDVSLSQRSSTLLRHTGSIHEDGAMSWKEYASRCKDLIKEKHLRTPYDIFQSLSNMLNQEGFVCVDRATAAQICTLQNGEEKPIQGHSSDRVSPKLFSHKLIEAGSAPYIYHLGSSSDESSIISKGMLSGGYEREKFDEGGKGKIPQASILLQSHVSL